MELRRTTLAIDCTVRLLISPMARKTRSCKRVVARVLMENLTTSRMIIKQPPLKIFKKKKKKSKKKEKKEITGSK